MSNEMFYSFLTGVSDIFMISVVLRTINRFDIYYLLATVFLDVSAGVCYQLADLQSVLAAVMISAAR